MEQKTVAFLERLFMDWIASSLPHNAQHWSCSLQSSLSLTIAGTAATPIEGRWGHLYQLWSVGSPCMGPEVALYS